MLKLRPIRTSTMVLAALMASGSMPVPADAGVLYRVSSLGGQAGIGLNNRGDVLWRNDFDWRDSDWIYGDAILHGYGPNAGGASHLRNQRNPSAPGPREPSNDDVRSTLSSARGEKALNDRGEVVGNRWNYNFKTDSGTSEAVVYRPGQLPSPVGDLGGGQSTATAIGNGGHIVGWSSTAAGDHRAFLAQDGDIRNLGTLPGTGHSVAIDVNTAGVAAGYAANGRHMGYFPGQTPEDGRAVLFQDGEVVDLGTLGGTSSIAVAVNDKGQVAGTSQMAEGPNHAFLHSDGVMIDLGTLGNPRDHYSDDSGATDLNNLGQIVGTSGGRAFLFDGEAMFDLEDLLEPDTGIRELWWAEAINDQGQILAWGWGDSLLSEHFVLTPSHLSQPTYSVPEPSTAAVFATLGGVFLAWRRLRR